MHYTARELALAPVTRLNRFPLSCLDIFTPGWCLPSRKCDWDGGGVHQVQMPTVLTYVYVYVYVYVQYPRRG